MSMTDPIADMLTRIRNGLMAGQKTVIIPASKVKRAILEILVEEGYLAGVDYEDDGKQGVLVARLKYDNEGKPVIEALRRLSKPGRRVYVGKDDLPKARSGYGTVIVSTSKGILTDRKARALGVGGEVICEVW
ncbi:MAG: 30S ribosomal protein S8 [Candidatus Dadabacteria bacterium]|nr:MAG: 30S ribosomal protein S8 [Candidatus Dadabacteria bacterium]